MQLPALRHPAFLCSSKITHSPRDTVMYGDSKDIQAVSPLSRQPGVRFHNNLQPLVLQTEQQRSREGLKVPAGEPPHFPEIIKLCLCTVSAQRLTGKE
eukprot:1150399-Pelagomonas_calceolata.AAC.7